MRQLVICLAALAAVLGVSHALMFVYAFYTRLTYEAATDLSVIGVHEFSPIRIALMLAGAVFYFAIAAFMWRLRNRIGEIRPTP